MQLPRMMHDPRGKAFTTSMTDECFRSKRYTRVADQMVYLLNQFGIPRYLDPIKRFAARRLPNARQTLCLPVRPDGDVHAAEKRRRPSSFPEKKRRSQNTCTDAERKVYASTSTILGEAILSEREAMHRLNIYLDDLSKTTSNTFRSKFRRSIVRSICSAGTKP